MSAGDTGAVAVAGGGVLGLVCAIRLAGFGWRTTLHRDPPGLEGASAVAAGMIAPASEAVLDGAGPYALLRAARDLWPALAENCRVELARDGAVHLMPEEAAPARLAAFAALGARAQRGSTRELLAGWSAAGLSAGSRTAVFTPEDWHLAPGPALRALEAAAGRAGVSIVEARVDPAVLARARRPAAALGADVLVLAAGWGAVAFADVAPEAARLSPIKGQLLRLAGPTPAGPVVRAPGGYLAPDPQGVIVGATMEAGATDLAPDPARLDALRAVAAGLVPALAHAPGRPGVGVRADTPDRLPLVGPSRREGVVWAAGARRNGWLLAPLVAQTVEAHLAGKTPGPFAAALDPRRFESGGGAAPAAGAP